MTTRQLDAARSAAERAGADTVRTADRDAPPAQGSAPPPGPTTARRGRWPWYRRRERLLSQLATGLLILGAWQLVATLGLVRPVLASSPGEVAAFLIASSGELWPDLVSTVTATLIAFVLASIVGVVVGIGLGLLPRLEAAVDPYLSALNSMPRIALGPLFVLYFGFGMTAKVALAFSIVVFILILNARAGVLSVDRELIRLSAAFNATKLQLFMKVLLPSSVPSIFAGLRLGLIYSLLGVVTSEIIASQTGLGSKIVYYSAVFQIEGIYAILIVLALIASLLNAVMATAERRLLRWQEPGATGGVQ